MEIQDCPLPEVASALGPFIKPRDEVAAIRRNLQAYLQKHLPGDEETPLSSVNLTTPQEEDVTDPPSALTGVRRAYWKALQANQDAQAKYDALKADLEALKRPGPTQDSSSINDNYIPLLRQKEKLRRLKVLERAYSSLPSPPPDSLDEQLKTHVGEQPTPPSTHPPLSSNQSAPEVDAKLLELKKAVITTKRRVEDQEARNAVAKASLPSNEDVSSSAKIAGLQKALQELTIWMEEQLTVIADAEAEVAEREKDAPPTPRVDGNGRTVEMGEIEAGYERYLRARERLVASIASPAEVGNDTERESLFPTPSTTQTPSNANKRSPPELLLPHIPHLASLKAEEANLLQQNAHIRRQLTASEAETARLIQRLAGESHLVQPGASKGKDWADAGAEAGKETEKVVLERVKIGEKFAGEARDTLQRMEVA